MTDTNYLLFDKLFERVERKYKGRNPKIQNISDSGGKHIMEKQMKHGFMKKEDFIDLMDSLDIKQYKNSNMYPIRLRKEFRNLWTNTV